jgi:hypothetical protein
MTARHKSAAVTKASPEDIDVRSCWSLSKSEILPPRRSSTTFGPAPAGELIIDPMLGTCRLAQSTPSTYQGESEP